MSITILGVKIENRLENAVEFQKIITKYGCEIRTRIGLHSASDDVCLNYGIVLLEVLGEAELLRCELEKYFQTKVMTFDY